MRWREWAGCFAPEKYDTVHDNEYVLFRQSAGLFDISPLFKYDIRGKDAAAFLSRVLTRDVAKLKLHQVAYCCWCDEEGWVIDDGTVSWLGDGWYRLTSANPTYRWLRLNTRGFDVKIEDVSTAVAALAVQGPTSRDVLLDSSDVPVDALKFFNLAHGHIGDVPVIVSRTGYTGDLGYEVWTEARHAERMYDAILDGGRKHLVGPAGLLALDIVRIEAGFIMADVDYTGSHHAMIDAQRSTPYELGLGWTVHLDRDPFVGQEALRREVARGSQWAMVGLEIDWDELEAEFDKHGLPPHVSTMAWRSMTPVFDGVGTQQVGRATSGTWSPLLKKNLALATVEARFAEVGTVLKIEQTVEFERKYVTARVVKRPFFDPPRKKSTPTKGTPDKVAVGAASS